ncbi:MAG: DUF2461 domain-containing protein [Acidimicrobiales bacterium]|jgi:uncharacterized protein (TIGR02453 family)
MSFAGWPAEAVEFFEDLEEDNTKAFWQAHIETYTVSVKHPMESLLAELEPEFGAGRLFRPYRDVRFSKDKSPYKTNIAAAVGPFGYVTLSPEGLGVGAGMHVMAPDQLERYRKAVDGEKSGTSLELIVEAVKDKGYACAPTAPLKTAPSGYPKDHPRIALLRGKGITVWKLWAPADWLGTKKAKERVVGVLRASAPLNDWLAAHVGESELADRPV